VATRGGPQLPYSVIASVLPCPGGWLVCSAKLQAATIAPEDPRVLEEFPLIFEERPQFTTIALAAPIGYPEQPGAQRKCDDEARALLGRRAITVRTTPVRSTVESGIPLENEHLDAITLMRLPKYREVVLEMLPYRQRTVYEAHPELSFHVINADQPLKWSKRREEGIQERRVLLEKRIPGIRRVLDAEIPGVHPWHLNDAAAMLWTARRIFAKAATRIPTDPEWDSEGLRREIVR